MLHHPAHVMPTGVVFKLPDRHAGIIKARSSLASKGLTIDGGVVDKGYVGEIKVILVNRHKWLNARIEQGDRIAQILIIPRATVVVKEFRELLTTKRGTQGFGSKNSMLASKAKRKAIDESRRDEAEIEDKHIYRLGEKLTDPQKN